QALGGLELGLVVVADAAFGHQPGRFVGKAVPTLARAGFGVLAGTVHHDPPVLRRPDCNRRRRNVNVKRRPPRRPGQKMSNASSAGRSSNSNVFTASMRSRSSAFTYSTMPPSDEVGRSCPPAVTATLTMPGGGSLLATGTPSRATRMKSIQIGSAARPPYSR